MDVTHEKKNDGDNNNKISFETNEESHLKLEEKFDEKTKNGEDQKTLVPGVPGVPSSAVQRNGNSYRKYPRIKIATGGLHTPPPNMIRNQSSRDIASLKKQLPLGSLTPTRYLTIKRRLSRLESVRVFDLAGGDEESDNLSMALPETNDEIVEENEYWAKERPAEFKIKRGKKLAGGIPSLLTPRTRKEKRKRFEFAKTLSSNCIQGHISGVADVELRCKIRSGKISTNNYSSRNRCIDFLSGAEKVTRHLNQYFTKLLNIIDRHGGDCVKFAGDALIVIFKEDNPYEKMTYLNKDNKEKVFENAEITMLRTIQGFSDVYALHLGGNDNQWEFLVAGDAFRQLQTAVDASKTGDAVVSPEVWSRVQIHCQGVPVSLPLKKHDSKSIKYQKRLIVFPDQNILNIKVLNIIHSVKILSPIVAARIEPYVPIPVREKLRSGIGDKWLAELRRSTAIFINLKGLALNYSGCNDLIVIRRVDNALRKMQQIIQQNQGYLRQFCVDDKGTVLIVVFGVPPFTWENNAVRAVKTAMEVKDMLNGIRNHFERFKCKGLKFFYSVDIQHGIGIATGDVYVGSVGSHALLPSWFLYWSEPSCIQEAMFGMNMLWLGIPSIQQLVSQTKFRVPANSIWVEENTHALAKTTIQFRWVKELKVKGKNKLIQVYHPEGLSRASALSTHKQLLGRQKELKEFSIAVPDKFPNPVFKLKEFLKKNSLQGPQKPSSRFKSRTRTSMGIGSINARVFQNRMLKKLLVSQCSLTYQIDEATRVLQKITISFYATRLGGLDSGYLGHLGWENQHWCPSSMDLHELTLILISNMLELDAAPDMDTHMQLISDCFDASINLESESIYLIQEMIQQLHKLNGIFGVEFPVYHSHGKNLEYFFGRDPATSNKSRRKLQRFFGEDVPEKSDILSSITECSLFRLERDSNSTKGGKITRKTSPVVKSRNSANTYPTSGTSSTKSLYEENIIDGYVLQWDSEPVTIETLLARILKVAYGFLRTFNGIMARYENTLHRKGALYIARSQIDGTITVITSRESEDDAPLSAPLEPENLSPSLNSRTAPKVASLMSTDLSSVKSLAAPVRGNRSGSGGTTVTTSSLLIQIQPDIEQFVRRGGIHMSLGGLEEKKYVDALLCQRLRKVEETFECGIVHSFRNKVYSICVNIDPSIVEFVNKYSKGNPFVCVEVVRTLSDRGMLEYKETSSSSTTGRLGTCILAKGVILRNLKLPTSIRSLLTMRLDHLPASELLVSKLASVLGVQFDREALFHIFEVEGGGAYRFGSALLSLEKKGIICETTGVYSMLQFTSPMLQEACLRTMSLELRASIHLNIAAYYEKVLLEMEYSPGDKVTEIPVPGENDSNPLQSPRRRGGSKDLSYYRSPFEQVGWHCTKAVLYSETCPVEAAENALQYLASRMNNLKEDCPEPVRKKFISDAVSIGRRYESALSILLQDDFQGKALWNIIHPKIQEELKIMKKDGICPIEQPFEDARIIAGNVDDSARATSNGRSFLLLWGKGEVTWERGKVEVSHRCNRARALNEELRPASQIYIPPRPYYVTD
eukprot:jgi/Bigna1/86586/estExt_fgenesh1_pg.C_120020